MSNKDCNGPKPDVIMYNRMILVTALSIWFAPEIRKWIV